MPAMLGCSTVCPKCKHEFACCTPEASASTLCCSARRSLHVLSGGGLVTLAPPQSPCPSPQISPSAPLSFVLPPFASAPLQPLPLPPLETKPETELQKLTDTVRALRQSGWYYEGLTFQQSHDLLKNTKVGTFLVRNSSDPRFLFSLSVQTDRGPTSVRLHYVNGYFRLDAQPHLQSMMPMFPSVIDLIQHYVLQFKVIAGILATKPFPSNLAICDLIDNMHVWVDSNGQWYSAIRLEKPLWQKQEPLSLKHMARLAVHREIQSSATPRLAMLPAPHTRLELPNSLIAYMSEYPHSI